MLPIFSVLFVIALSVLITRIATVALTHTGMSRQMAQFQARSAFTGVGYTTEEAEAMVRHPVRRRIIMLLMLLGNAGIVSVLASLVLSFVGQQYEVSWLLRFAILFAGVTALWWFAASSWVDRWLSTVISRALVRWTDLHVRDYARLLRLAREYAVTELEVRQDDWMAGHNLRELALREEGVIVLGVHRDDGSYLGAPNGDTVVCRGDLLILYGLDQTLHGLDQRRQDAAGAVAHAEAVEEHEERLRQQMDADAVAKSPESLAH